VKKTFDFQHLIMGTQQVHFGTIHLLFNGEEVMTSATAEGFAIYTPITGFVSSELIAGRSLSIQIFAGP